MSTASDAQKLPVLVGQALQRHGQRLVCAESCTGGLIAKLITDVPGSSAWLEGGWVVYSNAAKQRQLQVPEPVLAAHGAVSAQTVAALLAGALAQSTAHWAVAVSGVAGPGGGSADKPVGLVWMGWQQRGQAARVYSRRFAGNRDAVRQAAAAQVLRELLQLVEGASLPPAQ